MNKARGLCTSRLPALKERLKEGDQSHQEKVRLMPLKEGDEDELAYYGLKICEAPKTLEGGKRIIVRLTGEDGGPQFNIEVGPDYQACLKKVIATANECGIPTYGTRKATGPFLPAAAFTYDS